MFFKSRNKKIKELENKLQEFERKLEEFENDIENEFKKFDEILEKTQKIIDETFSNEYTFDGMTEVKPDGGKVENCPIYTSYTQKELAKLYGVNHHTIQKWEKGYYPPKEFIGRKDVEESTVELLAKQYRERRKNEQERIANKKKRKKSTTGV
jgi:DNA-binding XRE family transcriptional regulator